MQCFPLYSILLAVGNPTLDYLSLDIEGAELKVNWCFSIGLTMGLAEWIIDDTCLILHF